MASSRTGRKRLLWCIALVIVLCGAFSFLPQRTSRDYTIVATASNVGSVSFKVTHGTNHVFYYPSRVRWEADRLWKSFGFRGSHEIQRRRMQTYQPADVLWVTCAHTGVLPRNTHFEAVLLSTNGRNSRITSTGALIDAQRGVSLSAWTVSGCVASNHGNTLRIIDTSRPVDLVTIHVR